VETGSSCAKLACEFDGPLPSSCIWSESFQWHCKYQFPRTDCRKEVCDQPSPASDARGYCPQPGCSHHVIRTGSAFYSPSTPKKPKAL